MVFLIEQSQHTISVLRTYSDGIDMTALLFIFVFLCIGIYIVNEAATIDFTISDWNWDRSDSDYLEQMFNN